MINAMVGKILFYGDVMDYEDFMEEFDAICGRFSSELDASELSLQLFRQSMRESGLLPDHPKPLSPRRKKGTILFHPLFVSGLERLYQKGQ
jgi:hypothetical protein